MIEVNKQSSIKIKNIKTIYFDPIEISSELKDADIIFITHTHYDHFDKKSIMNIKNENTIIVGPYDMKDKCIDIGFDIEKIVLMSPNENKKIDEIDIHTVPAYNIHKEYHKREYNWLGYVIELNNTKYYIAGDTDSLEENKRIKVDIAFIPIGGTYTMNSNEAANFVNEIKPQIVIPIHYGTVVGTKEDLDNFKKRVNNIKVVEYIKI